MIMQKDAIVCVDDEAIILMSLIQELKNSFGSRFLYEQAFNAEKALGVIDDLIRDGIRVILIITDWLMPGINGDEFLKQVYQKHPDIQAIMITGNADDAMIERVRGFKSIIEVLRKPWKRSELIRLIETAIVN